MPQPRPASDEMDVTAVPVNESQDLDATVVPAAGQTASDDAAASRADAKKIKQLGDFKLVRRLGKGGMGEVFLAQQVSLDRPVALKVMNKQFSSHPDFVARFKREAQTMAKLDHPHIVRGYAVGEDQGLLFLAMELVQGRSMQDWLNQLGRLPVGDALHVTRVIGEALAYAHGLNLIHRDIKPDNMLVTNDGVVKLSDMGLAKATDEDMSMTASGAGLGTPFYMAPEQGRNAKHVDGRSDIYALGCTLYHFVTGKLPFTGDSPTELILAKEKGTFVRARSLNPEVPERLDLVIDKMLARDPKHRYATCQEMLKDLQSVSAGNPALSFIAGARAQPSAAPHPAADTTNRAGATKAGEHKWFLMMPTPEGKIRKMSLTTGEIKQQLKLGRIDPRTKISKSSDGPYGPLGGEREFEQLFRDMLNKEKVEQKGAQYKKLYDQIDRQERWRVFLKPFRNFFSNLGGAVSLILYLGAIGGAIFAVYYFWPQISKAIGMGG